MQQLLSGIGALRTGVKELYDGAYELAWGLYDLAGGADELADGAVELADGSGELTDGIDELYDGLREFHRDGMQELLDETSSINVSLSRKDALLDLSDGYNEFSAAKEVENGSVQFIYTIEEIEPELPIPTPTPQADATAEGQGSYKRFPADLGLDQGIVLLTKRRLRLPSRESLRPGGGGGGRAKRAVTPAALGRRRLVLRQRGRPGRPRCRKTAAPAPGPLGDRIPLWAGAAREGIEEGARPVYRKQQQASRTLR